MARYLAPGTYGVTPKKEQELHERMEGVGVSEDDLEESFIKGGGSGGQKIHKSANCVRLVHKESGTTVRCQKERTRALNRFFARRMLCEKLEKELLGKDSPQSQKQERLRKQKKRRKRRSSST